MPSAASHLVEDLQGQAQCQCPLQCLGSLWRCSKTGVVIVWLSRPSSWACRRREGGHSSKQRQREEVRNRKSPSVSAMWWVPCHFPAVSVGCTAKWVESLMLFPVPCWEKERTFEINNRVLARFAEWLLVCAMLHVGKAWECYQMSSAH